MKVYLFADSDHADDYFTARALQIQLKKRGVIVRFVNRMSTKLADLDLVTKHGVVEPLVILIVDETGVRARLTRLVQAQDIEDAMQKLKGFPTPSA